MPSPIFQADLPVSIAFNDIDKHLAAQQHYHNTYEISVQLDGSRTLIFDENEYTITPGKAFIVRPYVVHGQKESEPDSKSLTLHFSSEVLTDVMEPTYLTGMLDKLSTCIIKLNAEQLETMRVCFSQIEMYYSETDEVSKKFMNMSILLLLNYTSGVIDSCPIILPFEKRAAKETSIFTVLDYVNRHLARNITLAEASDYVHMSKSNFCRIFKKTTGVTFNHYLNKVKVESVKRFLLNTDLTLNEISKKTGFESADYMSKTFKKIFGISPAKFRAENRKNLSA